MTRMTVRSSSPTLVSAAAAIVGLAGARLCMADIVSRTMDVVLDGARIDVDGDGVPDVEFSLVKLPEVQAGGRVGLGLAARGRRNGASRCEVLERYSRYSGGGRDGGAFEASEGMSLRIAGETIGVVPAETEAEGGGGGGWGGGFGGGGWGGGGGWQVTGDRWVMVTPVEPVLTWSEGQPLVVAGRAGQEPGPRYIPVRLRGSTVRCGWIEYSVVGTGVNAADHRVTAVGVETGWWSHPGGLTEVNSGDVLAGDRGCTFGNRPPTLAEGSTSRVNIEEGSTIWVEFRRPPAVGVHYTWLHNGQPVQVGDTWTPYAAEGLLVMQVSYAQMTDAGEYSVRADGPCGSVESERVRVTISPFTPPPPPPPPPPVVTRIVDSARFGKRYTLLPPGTWTMAMSRAAQMGAQLVTIESQEENDFIRDQVLTFDGAARSAWIGLSDSAVEGQFRWMNGSTASYRNWSPGEPNESNGGEDCVEMYSTGRWNDLFSYAAYPFTVVQTVLPAPACPADVGSAGGVEGPDGVLDNNDFIVFVERLFRRDGRSDVGADGGAAGSDGRWDGNDFIVFVGQFFQGCP